MTPTTDPRTEQIRQIAEKVMGWKFYTLDEGGTWDPPNVYTRDVYVGSPFKNAREFDPFTTAAHCEMLMDRMRELGYCLSLTILVDRKCTALFYRDHESTNRKGCAAYDWHTVVCLAALEAMNAE